MSTPDCHTFRPEPLNTTVASFGSVLNIFWQESTNLMLKQYKNTERAGRQHCPWFWCTISPTGHQVGIISWRVQRSFLSRTTNRQVTFMFWVYGLNNEMSSTDLYFNLRWPRRQHYSEPEQSSYCKIPKKSSPSSWPAV